MSLFMRPTQGVEYVENFSQMYEQGREKEERELCRQVAYYLVKIRHGAQKACRVRVKWSCKNISLGLRRSDSFFCGESDKAPQGGQLLSIPMETQSGNPQKGDGVQS